MMKKNIILILTLFFSFSSTFADTFTDIQTGKSFNGYFVQKKRGDRTQVRPEKKGVEYLDLSKYTIQKNNLGRKNKVPVFVIDDTIKLTASTEAFKKSLTLAADQGPLFILIEIDTPGGKVDLTKEICEAIKNTENCTTVAYINGGQFGGAFGSAAIIAVSCDKVYINTNAAIGGQSPYKTKGNTAEQDSFGDFYNDIISKQLDGVWAAYAGMLARKNNRPEVFVRAMADPTVKLIEVDENGVRKFISADDKKTEQKMVQTLSGKGELLMLLAADAVKLGLADKAVTSREEVVLDLGASQAKVVKDNNMARAVLDLDKEREKLRGILADIEALEKDATEIYNLINSLADDLNGPGNTVHQQFYWSDKRGYNRRWSTGIDVYSTDPSGKIREMQTLLDNYPVVLNTLGKNYNKALKIAKSFPDLSHYVGTLEKGIESVVTRNNEYLRRLQYY